MQEKKNPLESFYQGLTLKQKKWLQFFVYFFILKTLIIWHFERRWWPKLANEAGGYFGKANTRA